MAQRPGTHRRPGAVAVGGGNKKGGAGWLKWLLGLLLLIALIVLLLLLLTGGDDDDKTASKGAATPTAAPTTAATATATAVATATPDSSTTTGDDGSLTSGGEPLTPGDGQALAAVIGQRALGKGLKVVSVNRGRGFWVGTSKTDRTFVEYGSAVGTTEQQTYKAAVGDTVDFRGPVRPAPKNPARTLKLNAADAKQLSTDGAYVNATKVTQR